MTGLKKIAKRGARVAVKGAIKVLPQLPGRPGRLTGRLAKDGGLPVRDTRFRPWSQYPSPTVLDWTLRLGPTMGRIFLSGVEGLPQPLANKFSEQWAKYCGAEYCLLLPHGTDALRVAVAAALDHDGFDYGGEIIVPNLSFIASASAVLDRRFGVALVDVDPETYNLDPKRVEEAIVPGKTRAIMAVHLLGQPADMRSLQEIARRHSLTLLEDAAQAHGAIHELGRVGSLGDAGAFSFQSWKNLTCGEGGAFTTGDPEIFDRAYSFHNVGRARRAGQRWGHESLGFNLRANEYIAAVLLHRLKKLESEQQTRAARFQLLREELLSVECVKPLGTGPGVVRHGAHMFVVQYRSEKCGGLTIDDFLKALQAEGIPLSRGYTATMSQQPALRQIAEKHPQYLRVLPTPVADKAVENMMFIPHNLFLGSEDDIKEIAAAFAKVQMNYQQGTSTQRETISPVRSAPEPARAGNITVSPVEGADGLLRFGILGVGTMGQEHARIIASHSGLKLVGVSDARPQLAHRIASDFQCTWFESPEQLIDSGQVDAVVIATPHWLHRDLAIAALKAGLHVLCEKPLTVTVADADEVLEVASKSPGLLAVVHQKRFEAPYMYVKGLLDSGKLGPVYRCSMIESAWRSEAYYQSSPWRGTWKGEGGGVLLNQAPHILDRYSWLCGMPDTVTARCDTNLHKIEVEDTASAILHHENGLHGYIHISTIEAPAISQTVISCDKARIIIENGKVLLTKLRDSIRERTADDTQLMGELESETREIQLSGTGDVLWAFYDDVVLALSGRGPLTCPGEDGRNAVELANAMILSSATRASVRLPLDRKQYTELIDQMINQELHTV